MLVGVCSTQQSISTNIPVNIFGGPSFLLYHARSIRGGLYVSLVENCDRDCHHATAVNNRRRSGFYRKDIWLAYCPKIPGRDVPGNAITPADSSHI